MNAKPDTLNVSLANVDPFNGVPDSRRGDVYDAPSLADAVALTVAAKAFRLRKCS